MGGDTYYNAKVLKQTLDEDGIAFNDTKIAEYGAFASSVLEGKFIFILNDTTPFPSWPAWFGNFATALARARFWQEENNDKSLWDSTIKEVDEFRKNHFEQPAAKTRRV